MAPFDLRNACQPKCLLAFAASEDGQDVVEYGLMIATIAMVVLLGTTAFGNNIMPVVRAVGGQDNHHGNVS
jgi:Flp pilus assembly pilin Flp